MNYYCRADGGFYSLTFHGFIPADSVELTDETYEALKAGQELGKWIVADEQGYPILIDPLPASTEVLVAIERQWRDERLQATDGVVSRHRDELEVESATTLTAIQYSELQVYRRTLRNWPDSSAATPSVDQRPITPAWLVPLLEGK